MAFLFSSPNTPKAKVMNYYLLNAKVGRMASMGYDAYCSCLLH